MYNMTKHFCGSRSPVVHRESETSTPCTPELTTVSCKASVLGPVLFLLYTADVLIIAARHDVIHLLMTLSCMYTQLPTTVWQCLDT